MKLEDALAAAKKAREYHNVECIRHLLCCDYTVKADDLIEAADAHLAAEEQKRNIYRKAFGLEPTSRHGGDS